MTNKKEIPWILINFCLLVWGGNVIYYILIGKRVQTFILPMSQLEVNLALMITEHVLTE